MFDVVEMKKYRWASPGVDYEQIAAGNLRLIPSAKRIETIAKDHQEAVEGRMFFGVPDEFEMILDRLMLAQKNINSQIKLKEG